MLGNNPLSWSLNYISFITCHPLSKLFLFAWNWARWPLYNSWPSLRSFACTRQYIGRPTTIHKMSERTTGHSEMPSLNKKSWIVQDGCLKKAYNIDIEWISHKLKISNKYPTHQIWISNVLYLSKVRPKKYPEINFGGRVRRISFGRSHIDKMSECTTGHSKMPSFWNKFLNYTTWQPQKYIT